LGNFVVKLNLEPMNRLNITEKYVIVRHTTMEFAQEFWVHRNN
jgi:hypothetical protein